MESDTCSSVSSCTLYSTDNEISLCHSPFLFPSIKRRGSHLRKMIKNTINSSINVVATNLVTFHCFHKSSALHCDPGVALLYQHSMPAGMHWHGESVSHWKAAVMKSFKEHELVVFPGLSQNIVSACCCRQLLQATLCSQSQHTLEVQRAKTINANRCAGLLLQCIAAAFVHIRWEMMKSKWTFCVSFACTPWCNDWIRTLSHLKGRSWTVCKSAKCNCSCFVCWFAPQCGSHFCIASQQAMTHMMISKQNFLFQMFFWQQVRVCLFLLCFQWKMERAGGFWSSLHFFQLCSQVESLSFKLFSPSSRQWWQPSVGV